MRRRQTQSQRRTRIAKPNPPKPKPTDHPQDEPVRKCLVTGARLAQGQMIRFVTDPDGVIVPDVEGRLPGRGLWVTAERAMIDTAVEKKLFNRGAKQAVKVPPDVADTAADLLKRRTLNLLGLARRAGQLVSGFEKVKAAVQNGAVTLVVQARDGAEEGRKKVVGAGRVPVLDVFQASELGSAVGRDLAVHIAVTDRALAQHILREGLRYAGLAGMKR